MNKYISHFLQLRCAGDVLNACSPINKAEKEVTESMAVIRHIKPIVLEKRMHYTLVDLCAGNALTSVIAAHLLPVRECLAIDKKPRNRNYSQVRRFTYLMIDIFKDDFIQFIKDYIPEDLIITSIHPCDNLASRVIEIYKSLEQAKHLILMPCCNGRTQNKYPFFIEKRLNKYGVWAWDLAQRINADLYQDLNVMSPKNIILVANKYSGPLPININL